VKAAALEKAESFERHARYLGITPEERATWQLNISLGEAYELLDHLLESYPGNAALAADVLEAKASRDPWRVLKEFKLQGFEIGRAADLH
jgi:hypothetical protein